MKIAHAFSIWMALAIGLAASGASAADDVENGKKIAKKCTACHTLNKGGKNRLGPNLFGVLGKPAGHVKDYKYSKALLDSGIVWDEANFMAFIDNPKKTIKGTKMSFAGIKKPAQRAELLAYFKTLTDAAAPKETAGNAEDGLVAAKKHCIVCHSFEKGGRVVFGPTLFDIYGKPAASIPGYEYSTAMKNSGLTWNDKNLLEFLSNPGRFLPGTTARFPGLKSAQEKADILAYLKTLK